MEDGSYLDEFIRNHRKDKTVLEKLRDAFRALVDKLTGGVRERPRNFLLILAEENFNPRPPLGATRQTRNFTKCGEAFAQRSRTQQVLRNRLILKFTGHIVPLHMSVMLLVHRTIPPVQTKTFCYPDISSLPHSREYVNSNHRFGKIRQKPRQRPQNETHFAVFDGAEKQRIKLAIF